MIIETLFPNEPMEPGQTLSFVVKRLAAKVDDLQAMLDDECRRSKHLDDMLSTIMSGAELHTSSYDGSKYILLGYIREQHPKFKELVELFNLKEEVKHETD